jgi:hypothetical protein
VGITKKVSPASGTSSPVNSTSGTSIPCGAEPPERLRLLPHRAGEVQPDLDHAVGERPFEAQPAHVIVLRVVLLDARRVAVLASAMSAMRCSRASSRGVPG